MKPKILIFYPDAFFKHPSSGEIEARCLLWGFQLAGFQADSFGLESEDLLEYNVFCIFTVNDQSKRFMDEIPKSSSILIFPNLDNILLEDVEEIVGKGFKKLKFVARSNLEYDNYSKLVGELSTIKINQWFIAPFQFLGGSEVVEDWCNSQNYVLAMMEPGREEGLCELLSFSAERNLNLTILTNNVLKLLEFSSGNKDINANVRPRVRHGSGIWFSALNSASYLFEPNERITASVLEKLWLGGRVIVKKHNPIRSALGRAVTEMDLGQHFIQLTMRDRKSIYSHHANIVAAAMIRGVFDIENS